MRVWEEWRTCRQITAATAAITTMTKMELDEALCRFVLEMRRKDALPILCTIIICSGIMRYLRVEGHFFKDSSFRRFRDVLDSEMKRLQGEGVVSKHRQAEPLT